MKSRSRTTLLCVILPLLVALGACSEGATDTGENTSVPNSISSIPTAGTYTDSIQITGIEETLLQGRPALSLNFSAPLDAFRSYNKWLFVYDKDGHRLDQEWVLSEDARSLYFLNIEPRKTYNITVMPGIIAKNQQELKSAKRLTIDTRHLQPVAGFSGKGMIIPAGTEAGLPVRSTNVDTIEVDYFKIPIEKLHYLLTGFNTASSEGYSSIDYMINNSAQVHSETYELPKQPDTPVETKLPLDKLISDTPGTYLAVLKRAGVYDYSYPTTYFTVSDIGLHLRQYKNQWSVFTSELASGKANSDVEVRVLNLDGQVIRSGRSDARGMLNLAMQPENDARLLLAFQGEHMALLRLSGPALDISDFELPAKRFSEREYFIYGPRDVYRPGETLQFSALLRDFDGRLIPAAPIVAELIRPDGAVANRQTIAPRKNGYYPYRYPLAQSAPTGKWSLQLSMENDFETRTGKSFLVEDFMPERIRMNFSEKSGAMLDQVQLQNMSIHAEYLYGSPAAGNSLSTELKVIAARSPFPMMQNFQFGPIGNTVTSQHFSLNPQELDQNGLGSLALNAEIVEAINSIKGPVELEYYSSVYESGGRPLERALQVYSWKSGAWPGIRMEFDAKNNTLVNQDAHFQIVTTTENGEPINGRDLSVQLINLNRKSYWEYNTDDGWSYEYTENPVIDWQQEFVSKSSPLNIQTPVQKGYYQLHVTDESGNTSSTEFRIGQDWWGYDDDNSLAARPDKINVTLDQSAYHGGDTINVQLLAPRPGHGFLIVENSEGILFSQRISLDQTAAEFKIQIPADNPDWRRHDIRIVTMIVQPEQQAKHGVPMRSLGIQPIPLNREKQRVSLSIDAPEKVEPQSTLKLRLSSDQLDENMMVTISAVDQGVLSVTDFKTPDPFDFFYQLRRTEVDSRDNFAEVLHVKDLAFARQRSGGDSDELTRAGERPESKLLIVSLFKGPVQFDEDGFADVEFEIPDFNGAVRIMASAFSDSKFGAADSEILVKSPIVTQLSLPRFAAYGDQTQLTLDIQNTLEQTQNLNLRWQLDGAELFQPSQQNSTLSLAKDQKQVIRLPVIISRTTGTANIQLQVSGGDIQFTRHWSLGLRPAYPSQTFQKNESLKNNESSEVDLNWLDGKLADALQLQFSVSAYPSLNTSEQWRSLLQYPYGCLEQTTSRARPLAMADEQTRLQWGVTLPDDLDRVDAVQNAINRLQTMQRVEGGFGLWNAHSPEEHWLTAYVSDFLLSARDMGFQVPQTMLDRALARLQFYVNDSQIQILRSSHADSQHYRFAYRSYAAYVLARQTRAPLGSLRQWLDSYSNESKSPLPLAHLAIALKLQGDGARAARAVTLASDTLRTDDQYLGDYGSVLRDTALLLTLNIQHKLFLPDADRHVLELSEEIYRRNYLSTQERDAILQLALALEGDGRSNPWSAQLRMAAGSQNIESTNNWSRIFKGPDVANVSLQATGHRKIFVSQTLLAHPLQAPKQEFNGFSIRRTWFDTNGKEIKHRDFKSGDFVIVRLYVTADKRSPDAMIVDLLPAGFELENPGLTHATPLSSFPIDGQTLTEVNQNYSTGLKHKEYRDDRFIAAVDIRAGSTLELTYLMRAVTPGRYQVPSAFVEDMYRPEYRALGAPFSTVMIMGEK